VLNLIYVILRNSSPTFQANYGKDDCVFFENRQLFEDALENGMTNIALLDESWNRVAAPEVHTGKASAIVMWEPSSTGDEAPTWDKVVSYTFHGMCSKAFIVAVIGCLGNIPSWWH
jgi:hypothetical protein